MKDKGEILRVRDVGGDKGEMWAGIRKSCG